MAPKLILCLGKFPLLILSCILCLGNTLQLHWADNPRVSIQATQIELFLS